MGSLTFISPEEKPLALDIQSLANRLVRLDISEPSRILECVLAQSTLFERVKARQRDDLHLLVLRETIEALSSLRISREQYRASWAPSYQSSIKMDQFEALYGRVKLIQERLHTTQSRNKNYADHKKYHADMSHALDYSTVQLDESLGYEEEPIAIVDRQVCQLTSKKISVVKV
ncbi:uncharacterized protein [Nicotiana tomentosiformis]|uniref:uncharacterized protein n=1 Tax=Nicotiana tomentosiformis TaxID=4098 RepID=UPI00388C4C6B